MTKQTQPLDLTDCVLIIDDFQQAVRNRVVEVKAIHSLVMSDPDGYCKSSKLGIIRGELDFLDSLLAQGDYE